jgi:hypothetical protein
VVNEFTVNEQNGCTYLQLPHLKLKKKVKHAFCTRQGEEGPLKALEIPAEHLLTLRQVHGAEVLIVAEHTRALTPPQPYDAVITDKKGIALGISTADCLPILMVDKSKKVIAAVHAGWRGIWRGVIESTISEMKKVFESSPADILVGIGPGIGPCCYEVKEDVASLFQNSYDASHRFIQKREGRTYLDLSRAARLELAKMDIPPENIEAIPLCTACRADLFFSFRRDKKSGRQVSFIMLV